MNRELDREIDGDDFFSKNQSKFSRNMFLMFKNKQTEKHFVSSFYGYKFFRIPMVMLISSAVLLTYGFTIDFGNLFMYLHFSVSAISFLACLLWIIPICFPGYIVLYEIVCMTITCLAVLDANAREARNDSFVGAFLCLVFCVCLRLRFIYMLVIIFVSLSSYATSLIIFGIFFGFFVDAHVLFYLGAELVVCVGCVGLMYFLELEQRESFLKEYYLMVHRKKHNKEIRIYNLLLINIVPVEFVADIKGHSNLMLIEPKREAVVLVSDLKDFTKFCSENSSNEVIRMLNWHYKSFDLLAKQMGIIKLKTVGDSCRYFMYSNEENDDLRKKRVDRMMLKTVMFAVGMQVSLFKLNKENKWKVEMRIGVGFGKIFITFFKNKWLNFDIFGPGIDIAQKLEVESLPGCINVSERIYENVRDVCKFRVLRPFVDNEFIEKYLLDVEERKVHIMREEKLRMYIRNVLERKVWKNTSQAHNIKENIRKAYKGDVDFQDLMATKSKRRRRVPRKKRKKKQPKQKKKEKNSQKEIEKAPEIKLNGNNVEIAMSENCLRKSNSRYDISEMETDLFLGQHLTSTTNENNGATEYELRIDNLSTEDTKRSKSTNLTELGQNEMRSRLIPTVKSEENVRTLEIRKQYFRTKRSYSFLAPQKKVEKMRLERSLSPATLVLSKSESLFSDATSGSESETNTNKTDDDDVVSSEKSSEDGSKTRSSSTKRSTATTSTGKTSQTASFFSTIRKRILVSDDGLIIPILTFNSFPREVKYWKFKYDASKFTQILFLCLSLMFNLIYVMNYILRFEFTELLSPSSICVYLAFCVQLIISVLETVNIIKIRSIFVSCCSTVLVVMSFLPALFFFRYIKYSDEQKEGYLFDHNFYNLFGTTNIFTVTFGFFPNVFFVIPILALYLGSFLYTAARVQMYTSQTVLFDCSVDIIVISAAFLFQIVIKDVIYRSSYLRERTNRIVNIKLIKERNANLELILSLMPRRILDEVRHGKTLIVDKVDDAFTCFIKVCGFGEITGISQIEMTLVLFGKISEIITRNECRKIKSIQNTLLFIDEGKMKTKNERFQNIINCLNECVHLSSRLNVLHFKIGLFYGDVSAGVIGFSKMIYDIVGDSVNISARLCQNSERKNQVHIVAKNLTNFFNHAENMKVLENTVEMDDKVGDTFLKGKGFVRTCYFRFTNIYKEQHNDTSNEAVY